MVAVPPDNPCATPVEELIVATPVALLLHVPPDTPSLNVIGVPVQNEDVPDIDPGALSTVIVVPTGVPQPVV